MDREPPKGLKWPAEGPHYTWGSTRSGVHTWVPQGADRIPICLGLRGSLVLSQVPGLIPGSHGVRIDLAQGSRNVCSVLFPDRRQNHYWNTHFLPSGRGPFKKQTNQLPGPSN